LAYNFLVNFGPLIGATLIVADFTGDSRQYDGDATLSLVGVSLLAATNPTANWLVNFNDCLTGNFCDPASLMSGSGPSGVNSADDADLPQLSSEQIKGIDNLARENGCTITICGGFAENAAGIENRAIAFETNPGQAVGPVPGWRNTGVPAGKDLDFWTPRGTDLPTPAKTGLSNLFPGIGVDNYNSRYPGLLLPPGSVTFTGRGAPVRNTAPWQKPYKWD
jgi:hypothetical protein